MSDKSQPPYYVRWQDLQAEVERLRAQVDTLTDVIERIGTTAEARIDAALALHKPKGLKVVPGPQYCGVCGTPHPCPTVEALGGEK